MSETQLPLLRQAHHGLRTFVVDTNVLLYDPQAIFAFDEHLIVIPITVIEEVDRFKKDMNETGRNARTVSRVLDDLRRKGSLRDGVLVNDKGGKLRVELVHHLNELPIDLGPDSADNRILKCAWSLQRELGNVTLVTRDTNMRLKGDAIGLPAEDYENAKVDVDEMYTGVVERLVPGAVIDAIYQGGAAAWDDFEGIHPNQFLVLNASDAAAKTALVRAEPKRGRVRLVPRFKEGIWGIFARNKEQLFAFDLLLDDAVQVVTINGMAGTGKTLMALACGLKKVCDDAQYRKLLVSRPIFPMGKDVGFLPGDLEQKLNPWMKPIFDNLELLFSMRGEPAEKNQRSRSPDPEYHYLIDQKIIEVEALTYIRGRSIPKQFLIVDEAQNLTPHEIKTILTRAGEGTKVVITGDPYQIDNPYVDTLSNGLTYTVERFKSSHLAGHITLRKGERSELAELAAQLL